NTKNAQKVDVFPAVEPFHRMELERATVLLLGDAGIACAVTSAEDILLAKLRWYSEGGKVSDRQWSDITGILSQNPSLDWTYLNCWAEQLNLVELLARARVDSDR